MSLAIQATPASLATLALRARASLVLQALRARASPEPLEPPAPTPLIPHTFIRRRQLSVRRVIMIILLGPTLELQAQPSQIQATSLGWRQTGPTKFPSRPPFAAPIHQEALSVWNCCIAVFQMILILKPTLQLKSQQQFPAIQSTSLCRPPLSIRLIRAEVKCSLLLCSRIPKLPENSGMQKSTPP